MSTEQLPRKAGERKTARVVIDGDPNGRDYQKAFLVTEMPADTIERWFRRVLADLARKGIAFPGATSMLGVAALPGFNPIQMLAWVDDDHLNAELMTCVMRWPSGAPPRHLVWGKVGADVEELFTLALLKTEVLALHLNFSSAADLWSFVLGLVAAFLNPKATAFEQQPTTPTSPTPSPSP